MRPSRRQRGSSLRIPAADRLLSLRDVPEVTNGLQPPARRPLWNATSRRLVVGETAVANREPSHGLPLCPARDPNQKSGEARTGPARWLRLRGGAPDDRRWPTVMRSVWSSRPAAVCIGPYTIRIAASAHASTRGGSRAGLDGPRRAMSGSSAAIVLITTAAKTASMTPELPARRRSSREPPMVSCRQVRPRASGR